MNTAQSSPAFTLSANEILADKISALAAHIHAATYRFLVLIREFDERNAWAEMGARSCAHWLNWRCGISVHTAREKVRVAHALEAVPKISAAFKRGELSYSKVRAVTRVATGANEEVLLNIALSGTASHIERVVRCELRCEREREIRERTEATFEHRRFSWKKCNDGTVEFFGRLPAEIAEHVIKAIDANLPEASANESPAVDIIETLRKNVPAGTSGGSAAAKPSLVALRADALVALCSNNCEGYEVTLHVPAGDSLRANALDECGTIPFEAARRICCDAAIVPVTEDDSGNVLDIGRRTRKVPPSIRRALDIRDKSSCRFPGCTHTRFLQAHHIEHWASGGTTCLNNLVLLCWKHHHLVHESGFDCSAVKRRNKVTGQTVKIVFKRPDGVLIPESFRLPAAPELIELENPDQSINASTCAARDHDHHLDVNTVIDALEFIRRQEMKKKE